MSSRSLLAFFMAIVAVVFVRCSEDDPKKIENSEIGGLVTFEQSIQKFFSGETALEFKATELQNVARIKVLIDNVEKLDQAPPASGDLVLLWNSKLVEDGEHEIIVKLIDAAGNEKKQTFTIAVRNVLMKYVMQPNSLREGYDTWVFLSDHEGKTIAAKRLVNNNVVIFESPAGFQDEEFMATTFTILERDMSTYSEITRTFSTNAFQRPGVITYYSKVVAPSIVGQAVINVTGIPAGQSYRAYMSGNNAKKINSTVLSAANNVASVKMSANASHVLVSLINTTDENVVKYKFFENVSVGAELNVSFADFKTANISQIAFGEWSNSGVTQWGVKDNEIYYFGAGMPGPGDTQIRVIEPESGDFDSYFSNLYVWKDTRTAYFVFGYSTSTPVLVENNLTAENLSFDGSEVTGTISGDATVDVAQVVLRSENHVGNVSAFDQVTISTRKSSQLKIVVPEIPTEIFDSYFNNVSMSDLTLDWLELIDYTKYDAYEDFVLDVKNGALDQERIKRFKASAIEGRRSTRNLRIEQ